MSQQMALYFDGKAEKSIQDSVISIGQVLSSTRGLIGIGGIIGGGFGGPLGAILGAAAAKMGAKALQPLSQAIFNLIGAIIGAATGLFLKC